MAGLTLLETLASLVTKSLVQVADDWVDPTEPEYDMLEIIRAFAFEKLGGIWRSRFDAGSASRTLRSGG